MEWRAKIFGDEDVDDEICNEPDDLCIISGIVDRRGMPDFSKAAKYTGSWSGMVFKQGIFGLGYYRDDKRRVLNLMELVSAEADAAPVVSELGEVIPVSTAAKNKRK